MPTPPTDVTVRAHLRMPVEQAGTLALSVAVAGHQTRTEHLTLTGADGPLEARAVTTSHDTRLHLVEAPVGDLDVVYEVTAEHGGPAARPVSDSERFTYLLPSRYCPSDLVAGFAAAELGGGADDAIALRVMDWIHRRTAYEPGSTTSTDDSLVPLHTAAGVCRDFAHLGVTLCRALGLPARYVSVYAPGLDPMDAHAVVEVAVDGVWRVFDPTRLAPRLAMVRIGTGRDAADVAVSSSLGARVGAPTFDVVATASPDLPGDDPRELVTLP
jgi:transglutaminase-like putative cysteine protease